MSEGTTSTPKLTLGKRFSAYLVVLCLPFVIAYNVVFCRYSERHRGRSLRRVIFNAATRFMTAQLSYRQLQYLTPGSHEAYSRWVKYTGQPYVVDTLDNGTRILWVGQRRSDRVLVYCHGGAFMANLSDSQLFLVHQIQQEFAKRSGGQEIGVAVLEYSVFPRTFSTQLSQLASLTAHLLATGTPPHALHFLGDSAGANLILQLLSHTLHPIPGLSPSPLPAGAPTGSVCLVSPWIALQGTTGTCAAHRALDVVALPTIRNWGLAYLDGVPSAQHAYVEASMAPAGWFAGLGAVARRVMVTVGAREMLYGDVVALADVLGTVHEDVRLEVEEGRLHDDVVCDMGAGVRGVHPTTGMIVDWLVEGTRG